MPNLDSKNKPLSSAFADETDADIPVFADAEEIDATDAFEVVQATALRAEPLPLSAYTEGSTGFRTAQGLVKPRELASTPLANLPSRVGRRFSPADKSESNNAPEQPRPLFTTLEREKIQDAVYPLIPERATSLAQLEQMHELQKQRLNIPQLRQTRRMATTDAGVAALLRQMAAEDLYKGEIPMEALASEERAAEMKHVAVVNNDPAPEYRLDTPLRVVSPRAVLPSLEPASTPLQVPKPEVKAPPEEVKKK